MDKSLGLRRVPAFSPDSHGGADLFQATTLRAEATCFRFWADNGKNKDKDNLHAGNGNDFRPTLAPPSLDLRTKQSARTLTEAAAAVKKSLSDRQHGYRESGARMCRARQSVRERQPKIRGKPSASPT